MAFRRPSYRSMNEYMLRSPNQKAVSQVVQYLEHIAIENISATLFDRLAFLPCGPAYTESVLDRALGFLRAQYDEERDSEWAIALRPWDCRLLNHSTGGSFTRVFCTKLGIPFDGCYDNFRAVGRLDNFLTTLSGLAALASSNQRVKGALDPWYIKELVFYQDPLYTSTEPGSIRSRSQNKSVWHFQKRFDEDLREGKLLTVTPKRIKLYEKLCRDAHEEEMEFLFGYDPNKVCLMWLRIIDLLKYLPNLEVFRWESDARVVESFLSAISHYCRKLKVLDINLRNGFDSHEYMLLAWNRFYVNMTTGKLFQSHKLLNDQPIAKYISDYMARDPNDRKPRPLPALCRVNLKLVLKMDRVVVSTIETVGKYTRHIQSLVIDRSKSHVFMNENRKTEQGEDIEVAFFHLPLGVTHLSLIGTDATMHNYFSKAMILPSIESLEIKDCQSLSAIYFPIAANPNLLRKLKVSFAPPEEAKERAYSYWRHYMLQKRLTFDFLRSSSIILDELDIRGDFGEPTMDPVEYSGLSTDLYFAVESQRKSLVRLQVVNNNIDFTLAEIGSIVCKAEKLTQLSLTCRAFKYQDRHGNWIEQGLGTRRNFERLLGLLAGNGKPFSFTILRTQYHPLDLPEHDRDGAGRHIIQTRTPLDYEIIVKKMVDKGLPLAQFGLFAEGETNAYGVFGVEWDEFLYAYELRDYLLQGAGGDVFEMYEEFEDVARESVAAFDVDMPRPVGGPPVHRFRGSGGGGLIGSLVVVWGIYVGCRMYVILESLFVFSGYQRLYWLIVFV